jgi:tRNA threonylcarbamoyladenosine biosynthesis protein TsaB
VPLILCIETSNDICSVSLSKSSQLINLQENKRAKSHAESLNTSIIKLFENTKYSLKDLSAIAISKGPGSYTGLRIGTSTAKGLCFALDIPLIGVDTLQALTYAAIQKMPIDNALYMPMIDARRMEVYTAVYSQQLQLIMPTKALIITENSLNDYKEAAHIVVFGNGSDKCKTVLAQKNILFIENIICSAQNMVFLAYNLYRKNTFEDVAYFEPFYLKNFQAKLKQNFK